MDDETPIDLATYAKAVGIDVNASTSGIHRSSLRQSFPPEWKEVCLEMLVELKERKRKYLGHKRLGWQHMRDLIMQPYDKRGTAGKILERDTRLTRQNLETWETGSEIRDDKFALVDAFIRRQIMEGIAQPIQQIVKEKQDRYAISVLSKLYQTLTYSPGYAEVVSQISGRFLYSDEILHTWFKYIVVRLDFVESGIVKITCAYCPFDIHNGDTADIGSAFFYDGFLIPFEGYTTKVPPDKPYIQPHYSRCLFKLMRPEFKGDSLRGYAEGEMVYRAWLRRNEKPDISIIADHPNTILAPGFNTLTLEDRYYPTGAVSKSGLDRFNREEAGEEFPQDVDVFKRYMSKITFHNDQINNDFLERIFDECYKGYLF